MIRMSRQNRCCAIKLLSCQHAHDLMWPRHGSEGEYELCRLAQVRIEPVRTADYEHESAGTAIAVNADATGKIFAGDVPAPLVEQRERSAGGQERTNGFRLLALAILRPARTRFVDLAHFEAGQTDGANKALQSFGIARDKIPFGPSLQPPDCNQQ